MSLLSIVAVASGMDDDTLLLTTAARLAGSGSVRVIPAFPDLAADLVFFGTSLGRTDDALLEQLRATERVSQKTLGELARHVDLQVGLHERGGSMVVDHRELSPADAIARAAVLADAVAFSGVAARGNLNARFAETLITTRAPCLVVNDARTPEVGVIAWDGSAQAGRAVRVALPLLRAMSDVVIVRNVDDKEIDAAASDPRPLLNYLECHGVKVAEPISVHGALVGQSILTAASKRGASLIVAGAYGRQRLYELLLGGTTRELLNDRQAPNLLLSH